MDATVIKASQTFASDDVLIAEVPPAMLRALRKRGIQYVFAWPVWMVGGMTSLDALFAYLDWFPFDVSPVSIGINFGVQSLGALLLHRYLMRAPLKGEIRYRRRHGKWRWEK